MEEETIKQPERIETIKLTKGMKDTYSWEIRVVDEKIDKKTIAHLAEVDANLKELYLKGGLDEDD